MLTLLASYPKSGNTWLRALLTNYFLGDGNAADINSLLGESVLNNRALFDEEMGVDSAFMTAEEIDLQRPEFCRVLQRQVSDRTFVKIHDAYCLNQRGEPLFPADAVSRAIYPVRNPLAVVVSYAHHSDYDIDRMIDELANKDSFLGPTPQRSSPDLKSVMKSWSAHVTSWLDQKSIPIHLIRYEDIHSTPHDTLSALIEFLGEGVNEAKLNFAISNSNFEKLRGQETEVGFRERPFHSRRFFRSGKTDDWRETLSKAQQHRVERVHGEVMARLGYL